MITSGAILEEVAHRHGCRPDQITGDSQSPAVVRARAHAAYRMMKERKMSLPEIGRRLDRHHTTVWHMIRKYYGKQLYTTYDPNQPDESGIWAI